MVYIIDDKGSRQIDFGWDENAFKNYKNQVLLIRNKGELANKQMEIIQNGNIVLFHESFPEASEFKSVLEAKSDNLFIAYFSGSKGARYISENGKKCLLPPDVLYSNLKAFLNHLSDDKIEFKYLLFGENFGIEEILRNKIKNVNEQNVKEKSSISCTKNLFFAVRSDLQIEPPFILKIKDDWKNWDLFNRDITDEDIDKFVKNRLNDEKYDLIYIPLCFGNIFSDYLGLRLAAHIRLTKTINQFTPIYIYGVADFTELKCNYCFDVLKTSAVKLIGCDNASFIKSLQSEDMQYNYQDDLRYFHLDLPTNLGLHSIANLWGVEVLAKSFNIEYESREDVQYSLYFKYLMQKNNSQNKTSRFLEPIEDSKKHKILLIDDQYNQGWEYIIKKILPQPLFEVKTAALPPHNDKHFIASLFNKEIKGKDYDLIFLDLRLRGSEEEDFYEPDSFSGMKLLREIKNNNAGQQVIMLTASNKSWNLKALLDAGADGYYMKESPEYNFSNSFSFVNSESFITQINSCLSKAYLKGVYSSISEIKKGFRNHNKNINYYSFLKEIETNLDIAFSLEYLTNINDTSEEGNNKFAFAYLALYQTLEIINNNLVSYDNGRWVMINKELAKRWNNDYGIELQRSKKNIFPEWMKTASLYKFYWKQSNYSPKDIHVLFKRRNAFIHKTKDFESTYKDIYSPKAFEDLFDYVKEICDLLSKDYKINLLDREE